MDTSALFAVLNAEDDAAVFVSRMLAADERAVSSATLVELGSLCLNRLPFGLVRMKELVAELSISTADFDGDQARIAIEAYARFGKGRKTQAKLNLGDCFSYALARSLDVPLLFKGNDFTHTDIRSALEPR